MSSYRARLALAFGLILSGCAHTTPQVAPPCLIPVEATNACAAMCVLPDDASEHDLDVSLMAVLSCHIADAKAYAECAATRDALLRALRECQGK